MTRFDESEHRAYYADSVGASQENLSVRSDILRSAASDLGLATIGQPKTTQNPLGKFITYGSSTPNENLLFIHCEGTEDLVGYCVADDSNKFLR